MSLLDLYQLGCVGLVRRSGNHGVLLGGARRWSVWNNAEPAGVHRCMGLNRLWVLFAASTACLFLILILCIFGVEKPVATGIWMPIVRLSANRGQFTCEGRYIFIQLLADGKTKINGAEIHPTDLTPRIGAIMESRMERVVYLVPDPDISYARFVETLNSLNKAATDMHVAVLSGSLRNEYFQRSLEPCDIVWPN